MKATTSHQSEKYSKTEKIKEGISRMIKAEEYISALKEEMHETIQKEQRKGKLILPKINI